MVKMTQWHIPDYMAPTGKPPAFVGMDYNYRLKGIIVPLSECKTETEAIAVAEGIVEERFEGFWDKYVGPEATAKEHGIDPVLRSDTKKGQEWLEQAKTKWTAYWNEALTYVRDTLDKNTNEDIMRDGPVHLYISSRLDAISPIWGDDLFYVNTTKDFDIQPSWLVFVEMLA